MPPAPRPGPLHPPELGLVTVQSFIPGSKETEVRVLGLGIVSSAGLSCEGPFAPREGELLGAPRISLLARAAAPLRCLQNKALSPSAITN